MRSVTVIEIFIFQGERVRLAGHLSGNWGGGEGSCQGESGGGEGYTFLHFKFQRITSQH